VLDIICNHLELVSYNKNTCVVEAGKPLGSMIFVLRGKIKLIAATRSSSEITESCDDKILEDGGFYGEQLLSWASPNNISFSNHPVISTQDVKCETKVEALILKAEDLRSAVSKCGSQWNFNNFMSSQKLVDDGRDGVANTGASAPTSTNIEQTIRLHQGHDMILEQLVLIRETMFQRLDDQGQRLDNQGRRLDEMAAFLARLGYTGTSPPPPAP
jgi:cyclic nucleotide gated channel